MSKKFYLEGKLGLDNKPFIKGMAGASTAAGRFATKLASIGFKGLTLGASAATAAATAFGVYAAKTIAEYGKEMSKVKALTGATSEEFERLDKLARKMGATTSYKASEAAAGMAFLAQAGFKVNEILGSSEALLNLAAAGGIGLAESMDIASNIMRPFNMNAEEATRVSDVLATTAARTNTNVLQLGEAFKQVAPISNQLGISFEETSAAIGLLGNAGIQASAAGTALRNILARLVKPTTEVEGGLTKLGIHISEVNPATHSLSEIMQRFALAQQKVGDKAKFAGAAVAIFGLRANAAGGSLVGMADKIAPMTKQLEESGGAAKRMSQIMLDNLWGDMKILVSVFQELSLAVGEGGFTGVLRQAAQWATRLITAFNESGGAKKVGDIIQNAADAIRGAFADPDKLMRLFGAGLKYAIAGGLTLLYRGIEFAGEALQKIAQGSGITIVDSLMGGVALLQSGLKLAADFFVRGLMEAGTALVSLIQSGIEHSVETTMQMYSKIPGVSKMLGLENYQADSRTFGQRFEANKKSKDDYLGKSLGIDQLINEDLADFNAIKSKTLAGQFMDKVHEFFAGIGDGSTEKKAKEELLAAYENMSQYGEKIRKTQEAEVERKKAMAEMVPPPPLQTAAGKKLQEIQAQVGDRDKWGFTLQGKGGINRERTQLLRTGSLSGAQTKSMLGGEGSALGGVKKSWRYGDHISAREKKKQLEEAKKKAKEQILQEQANDLLKEQVDILKKALLATA